MGFIDKISQVIPEVAKPTQKKLPFKEKIKWTIIILVLFYVLGMIPLFGLGQNSLEQFQLLATILGAEFGSIISLGIGPIVTASIVLQLLNGSGILKFDLTKPEGKKQFQGLQKIMAIFFIIFEGIIYVFMGGLSPNIGENFFQLQLILVFQLCLGGLIILLMDEVVSKWGIGSGISLFIAANVSKSIIIRGISFVHPKSLPNSYVGAIPEMFRLFSLGEPTEAIIKLSSVAATLAVFVIAVYLQSMKVEIPLSFGRIRGHGVRWPLQFMYTSNIPVILASALFANLQLWARLLENWGVTILGTYGGGNTPQSGLISWLTPYNLLEITIKATSSGDYGILFNALPRVIMYIIILTVVCVVFSWFWVQTSGMDARSQAKQIMASGLQLPGFRRDERVLESVLARKINPLTIMGAISVGIIAGIADISGALTNGTGLLLTVMIVYKLYEEIAKEHMMDMNPLMRKFMGG